MKGETARKLYTHTHTHIYIYIYIYIYIKNTLNYIKFEMLLFIC